MRFILIVKNFPPVPDATGRIVFNIANELVNRGHSVDIITRGDHFDYRKINEISVHFVRNTYWDRLCERRNAGKLGWLGKIWFNTIAIIRKLCLAVNIASFPDVELSVTRRILKLYKRLVDEGNKYDCVMGVFRPYSCLKALMKIKQYTPDIYAISYVVDLVETKDCPRFMPFLLYKKLVIKGDRAFCTHTDLVVLPKVVKNKTYSVFKQYSEKVVYLEFPTFVNNLEKRERDNNGEDHIKFVFAGTINRDFRNPQKMLETLSLLANLNSSKEYIIDIFGGGDCTDVITSFEKPKNLQVNYHGKVSKSTVTKYEAAADFLMNITNDYSSVVPSKVFELFAACKPIISIVSSGDDGSFEYLEKYPMNCFVDIDVFETQNIEISKLNNFILKYKNQIANYSEIRRLYNECTPEYCVSALISKVENK